jgi:hypothetical protein
MSSDHPPHTPHSPASETERQQMLTDLHELVDALDRRVPRPERDDEGAIARDSADMKREAEDRIEELQPHPAPRDTP